MVHKQTLTLFAPAKINLFLHITGKRRDGYHLLDSLVAFADIGDTITIEPAPHFSFHITGPFAKYFKDSEQTEYIDGSNLITRAVKALSQITKHPTNFKITLDKHLPLASGLGGGSSDAATALWGFIQLWSLEKDADYLLPLMLQLGADVPVCLNCRPTLMRGIGDELQSAPTMPEIPIILINPMRACPTADIFLRYNKAFKPQTTLPTALTPTDHFIDVLKRHSNDLYMPAIDVLPDIKNIIHALDAQNGCMLARMSGSGASCFGLFDTTEHAVHAATIIQKENPDWWVKTGYLNRPERY
ncbi:MAG: 4-(cytidine 5'-diphospho)-2-C-methyl-D-erythritol kinase [Alphaproteobacteria bacterium]